MNNPSTCQYCDNSGVALLKDDGAVARTDEFIINQNATWIACPSGCCPSVIGEPSAVFVGIEAEGKNNA